MTKRDLSFFNIAKEISLLSDINPKIGCVVVEGKRIVSSGCNSDKTRPLQKRMNIYRHFSNYDESKHSGHAEINALSPLIGKEIDWTKIKIYVYRELRDGTIALARPCVSCMKLIQKLGIKNIYYSNDCHTFSKEKVDY